MAIKGDGTISYEQIPKLEQLKLHVLALLHGIWFLLKKAAGWLWKTETLQGEIRDKPPPCLVDNSLGCHLYIKIQSTKFHFVEAGVEDSPLVVLLHGFPDFWFGWRHQIKFLSQHFRVVAIDLKGFGDSDKPLSRVKYKIKTLVNELLQLIVSFQSTSKILIGHDLGAYLGWHFVTAYPDCINKFVAISCPHPNVFWDYLSTTSRINSKWIQFAQMPILPEIDVGQNNLSIIDDFYSHLRLKKEETLIKAYKYVFSRPEDWTGPINYYRNLPFYRIGKRQKKISVPVLLIVGNSDPCISLESIMTSTDYVSTYTMKVVKGAAHFPHQENPEFVNDLLLQFLTVEKKEAEPTSYGINLMNRIYVNTKKYKIPW